MNIPISTPEAFAELAWYHLKDKCCVHPDAALRAIIVEKKDFVGSILDALDSMEVSEDGSND